MTGTYPDNLREQHIRKFQVVNGADDVTIMYGDQVFVQIRDVDGLPKGFEHRFILMITEMLQGKRTELWDSQVVFGEIVKPTREQLMAVRDHFNTQRNDENETS